MGKEALADTGCHLCVLSYRKETLKLLHLITLFLHSKITKLSSEITIFYLFAMAICYCKSYNQMF